MMFKSLTVLLILALFRNSVEIPCVISTSLLNVA
jgi:hypothetical protein